MSAELDNVIRSVFRILSHIYDGILFEKTICLYEQPDYWNIQVLIFSGSNYQFKIFLTCNKMRC